MTTPLSQFLSEVEKRAENGSKEPDCCIALSLLDDVANDAIKLVAICRELVEALEELAVYQEFRPVMMQFRLRDGSWKNFGRHAREALTRAAALVGEKK